MLPRTDDKSVADEEDLLRRIWNQPQWVDLKRLAAGDFRPSSVAFLDNHTREVSVFRAVEKTPEEALDGFPDYGLVSITAGFSRSQGLIVATTPEVEDPSHRVLCDDPGAMSLSRKAKARALAGAAVWIVRPKDYRL